LARKVTGQGCFAVSAFNFAHLRSLMAFGSGVLASTLINFLLSPLSKFVLTRYVGPSTVPVYDMAFTMTMQLRGVLDSGFSSLMPEVSRLKALASEHEPYTARQ
jgi:O-antigen/teichoic acid export membrane protein